MEVQTYLTTETMPPGQTTKRRSGEPTGKALQKGDGRPKDEFRARSPWSLPDA